MSGSESIKKDRKSVIHRQTKETDIRLELDIDGAGTRALDTGIGFFDHMLNAFAVHGSFDINLSISGDLEVDGHHTVEDCGIVIGRAFSEAIGDKTGINRFGCSYVPMDEALARCVLDICGRPYLVFDADFAGERTGSFELCLVKEFFHSFAYASGITVHIHLLEGENDHHACEAIFKSFARALRQAVDFSGRTGVLSSKGVLE